LNLYPCPAIDAAWILPLPSLLESKVWRIGLSPLLVLCLHSFLRPPPPSHMQHENYRWRQFTRVQGSPYHR
ncbi:hypothetical protein BDZ91DRAFT_750423, partial [Kalaharituber pfeilii]